ncbi:MAG: hypothetical protein HQ521_19970 [Bacteroidetes bacterium]|nr:hypothetical protein [Bacteroidota bacterium]
MKLSTLILVITILFLAIKPGIDFISLHTTTEQTCCSGQCNPIVTHQNSSDNHNNDCTGKSCNPFQVCCSCVLQSRINPAGELFKPEIPSKQFITYGSTFCNQFTVDFWHPPKIV